jgi:cyclic-di-GMP-binding protein
MPSFDIVSEVDAHELSNAVDQSNRQLTSRFDFKGVDATFTQHDDHIMIKAPSDFQVQQMVAIIKDKLAKRQLDSRVLDFQPMEVNLSETRQRANICQGIDTDQAKKLVKSIKDSKLKVQASIQGDKIRITGKKRDDLQAVISFLKESKAPVPLQYNNFRD